MITTIKKVWLATMLFCLLSGWSVAQTNKKGGSRAVPANDAAEDATVITPASITYTVTQDASGATNNDGPIMYSDYENGGSSGGGMDDGVWYKFDPKITGDYTISVDADWDVEIAVLFGSDGDAVPDSYKANVDDLNGAGTETITVKLYNDDACYWINIGDADWSLDKPEGEFTLRIEGPAVNDAAENATEIEHGYFPKTITQDASGATNNDGFILFKNYIFGINGLGMNDGVWYKFTPKVKGTYIISVNADWDAEIGIFYRTDPGSTPNKYKTHIDGNVSGLETDTMMLYEGNTYWINIGDASSANDNPEGEFTLKIEGPDVNEKRMNAIEIPQTSIPYSVTQTHATQVEDGFLVFNTFNGGGALGDAVGMNDGVWYKISCKGEPVNYRVKVIPTGWSAEIGVIYTIDNGSSWDYKTHKSPASPGAPGAPVEVVIDAGVADYYICVGAFHSKEQRPEGKFKLTITAEPDNDKCDDPISMPINQDSRLPWSYTQTSATGATGAPFKYNTLQGGSGLGDNVGMNDGVWYKFDPQEATGEYTIQVIPDNWDAEIGIFYGICGNLIYKTHGDNGGTGKMDEAVLSNPSSYYYNICVGSYSYSQDNPEGPFEIFAALRPENDNYQNATQISSSALPYSKTQDASGATNIQKDGKSKFVKYSDYDGPDDKGMNDGVWYKFKPQYEGKYKITVDDGVGDDWDSEISVFWGNNTKIHANGYKDHDNSQWSGGGEELTVKMYPQSTYYINVGYGGKDENMREGKFTIKFKLESKSVTQVSVDPTEATLEPGDTKTLTTTVLPNDATNKKLKWESSDDNVATVDANGVVTAVAGGTAIITVTSVDNDSKSATCEVTVPVPVSGVALNETEIELAVDSTFALVATVSPNNATNKKVTWGTSDAAVATVDANGLVTAVAEGTAHIIVTTDEGNLTDTCTVTVTKESTGIQDLNVAEVNLYPNPTNGQFFVEVPASGKLEITNLAGQKVQELSLKAGKNEIYIKQPGLYFIYLTGKDYRTVKKLIVK